MGSKTERKKRFLVENPVCCFCGGSAPAREEDHVPSRVIFDNRQWPEGYLFPACVQCNRATRHDEQVVAMLSRLYPDATTPEGKAATLKRVQAVAAYYPGLLEEMDPTIRQIRTALKKYGIEKPQGVATSDIPFVYVGGPLVNSAVQRFGRKLFLGLYYMHTGKILPLSGGIAMRWYSNMQLEIDEVPRELAELFNIFPTLERSRRNLSDQFFYRYGLTEDKKGGGFFAFFRRSFGILGFIYEDQTVMPDIAVADRLGPFVHG